MKTSLIALIYLIVLLGCIFICHALEVQSFEKTFDHKFDSFKKHRIHKRSLPSCSLNFQSRLNQSSNVHIFHNDSNPTISLTWSGENGVILALTTMSSSFVVMASRLYRSTNRGKVFVDISSQIQGDHIRKNKGILVNPADTNHVMLLGYNSLFKSSTSTNIYISTDAGEHFSKTVAPFIIQADTVKFHPKYKYRVLTLSHDHKLWVSTDSGSSWKAVASYVLSAKWDPLNHDVLYFTVDPLHVMNKDGIENELYRYNVAESKSVLLAQHVHSFAVQDNYLFLSIQFTGKNGSRVMHVSKNEGHAWNAAQLPMIAKEQFYSLLDMSEDMVFVHVDTPGDTGHGNIYTSDERGIVYSLSLERHLYPNNKGITDFYKVNSLPGVYITTQLDKDNTVHSRITFDKGGLWQAIAPPDGSKCPPTEKVCNLQIHNSFSASKGVHLPSLPLSSKNTVGLILAHGNLGDGLSFKPPDVYLSDDGGYSWIQPSHLKGPHFYGIGDSGGLLFAIPSTNELMDTVLFSLDEGQCWYEYKFADRKIRVTGISAEPGEKSTDVSIWGWDQNGDGSWLVFVVEFGVVLGQPCHSSDYRTWNAHESNSAVSLRDNCMLGAKRTFLRRKKGTACLNGNQLVPAQNAEPCRCQNYDFLCDYGFKRNKEGKCVEDYEGRSQSRDICIDDNDELITTQGYRKIPGDLCEGGYEPPRKVKNLHKKCAKTKEKKEDFGVDPRHFVEVTPATVHSISRSQTGLIIFLVLAVLSLGTMLTYILYKKRRSVLKVRYTPLSTKDDDAEANGRSPLAGSTSVVEDNGGVLVDANGSASGVPTALLSYHDDSDDDLIVT